MDQDKFALVEKILKDIESSISKNAELNSFEVVPVDSNFRNKCPVLNIDNCLGLESWCVKHVYMYCYNELMDKYFSKLKRRSHKVTSLNAERLTKLLNVTLLLNPELGTLWNRRREMMQKGLLDRCFELRFSRIVLSRKPKCNDAFAYRRWLLETIFNDLSLETNDVTDILNDELNICDVASEKSPNNYHSWSHRTWLLQRLGEVNKNITKHLLYMKEYEYSQQWISRHVSDFSCFHYRQFCIRNVLHFSVEYWNQLEISANVNLRKNLIRNLAPNFPNDSSVLTSEENLNVFSDENLLNLLFGETIFICNCAKNFFLVCRQVELLFHELNLNNELISFYKHHETLWYHRRFVLHELLVIMYDFYGFVRENGILNKRSCKKCHPEDFVKKQAKIVRYDSSSVYSCLFFKILYLHEKKFIEKRLVDGDNYADRHDKYLRFVEGLNNFV